MKSGRHHDCIRKMLGKLEECERNKYSDHKARYKASVEQIRVLG
jgi:hypothetical protein